MGLRDSGNMMARGLQIGAVMRKQLFKIDKGAVLMTKRYVGAQKMEWPR